MSENLTMHILLSSIIWHYMGAKLGFLFFEKIASVLCLTDANVRRRASSYAAYLYLIKTNRTWDSPKKRNKKTEKKRDYQIPVDMLPTKSLSHLHWAHLWMLSPVLSHSSLPYYFLLTLPLIISYTTSIYLPIRIFIWPLIIISYK